MTNHRSTQEITVSAAAWALTEGPRPADLKIKQQGVVQGGQASSYDVELRAIANGLEKAVQGVGMKILVDGMNPAYGHITPH